MRLSDLTGSTADALRHAGSILFDLMTPTVRLGVTGLARSGKTVFITALVRSLIAGGRLPFFSAMADGRIVRAYLEPQPDDAVPRFQFEKHVADLTATPPRWPESTRRISQLRLTVEYASTHFWKRQLGRERLHIDIVDYPGEWLLDLPLLGIDYREWSRTALEQSRVQARKKIAKPWHASLSLVDPTDPAERTSKNRAFVDAVVRANVLRQVVALPERSEVLRKMRDAGSIKVVGGLYDIETGQVEFLTAS